MAKYVVTAPLVYSRVTGAPSSGLGTPREVVRHRVGDVVELEDRLAIKFHRCLAPYSEPKPARRKKDERTEREADEARKELGLSKPGWETRVVVDDLGRGSGGDQ